MKAAVHVTNPRLLERQVGIALVGAGGSGSQVLSGLARLDRAIRALGHPGGLDVVVYDPDQVSEANVGKQLFGPGDVGHCKATVLVHRVNVTFGLEWRASAHRFLPPGDRPQSLDMVISCVDSAASRREVLEEIEREYRAPWYWLDLGNRQRDGQVVLGEPQRAYECRIAAARDLEKRGAKEAFARAQELPRLPTVMDLFPELLDRRIAEDDRPSCSLAEALESQDLYINQAVATWGLHLLWSLLRDGRIENHGYFLSLESGRVNPLPVPALAPKKRRRTRSDDGEANAGLRRAA